MAPIIKNPKKVFHQHNKIFKKETKKNNHLRYDNYPTTVLLRYEIPERENYKVVSTVPARHSVPDI